MISSRHNRFLDIAKKLALRSPYKKFRHGAILVKGGSIRNGACNSNDYCSFGAKFRKEPGKATIHAEIGAVLGIDRSVTEGATVYVARLNKREETRLSKPCSMCEAVLRHVGIKKVIYTVSDSEIEVYRL